MAEVSKMPGSASRPKPRRWYRPGVLWEPTSPWWGFRRLDEYAADVIPGLLPVRALFIGPVTLTWLAKEAR